MIDVALATKNRIEQFKQTMLNLNEQTVAHKMLLYILDGNNNNEISDFIKSQQWNFSKIQINQDQQIFPNVRDLNWPKLYNWIINQGSSPYLTYWSDDVIVNKDCFEIARKRLETKEKYGAVVFGHYKDNRWENVGYLTTPLQTIPCINYGLIKREAFTNIDDNYKFYHADSDLSMKIISKGWTLYVEESCQVEHSRGDWENPASLKEDQLKDRERFLNRWANYFPEDMYKLPPGEDDYLSKVKLGHERMHRNSAVICTLLKRRDPVTYKRLDNLAKLFRFATVIIVTPDSYVPKEIKNSNYNFRVFYARENKVNMKNIYMTAAEMITPCPKYCLVVDPKMCISQKGIAHSIGTGGWDAVGSNCRLLGNSHEFYFDGPSIYLDQHLSERIMDKHKEWIQQTHLKVPQKTNYLMRASNCFGGLMIYIYPLIKNLRYKKGIGINKQMKTLGFKRLKVNPNQMTLSWYNQPKTG